MSKEICISSTPHETRLAILEDEQLTEVYYERENEYTLAGSIYKGRVTRVLPGMQSAFVDLGLERDAFLYVTDFMEEQEDSSDFERVPSNGRQEEGQPPRPGRTRTAGQGQVREPQRRESAPTAAPGRPRTGWRVPVPRQPGSSTAQTRPGRFGRRHPHRWASLRMAPGGGVAAAAAARASVHRKGGPAGRPAKRPMHHEPTETASSAAEPVHRKVQPTRRRELPSSTRRRFEAPNRRSRCLPGESLSKYGGQPAG